jgi:hypothetical protein
MAATRTSLEIGEWSPPLLARNMRRWNGKPACAMAMHIAARESGSRDKRGQADADSTAKIADQGRRPDSGVGSECDQHQRGRQRHDGISMATTVVPGNHRTLSVK